MGCTAVAFSFCSLRMHQVNLFTIQHIIFIILLMLCFKSYSLIGDLDLLLINLVLLQYIGYGIEGSILVLQTCLDHLNIYENDLKNMKLAPVIGSVFRYILEKPNFTTIICESLRTAAVNETLLENLCNALQLSSSEKIGVGLALSDSENLDIRMCGKLNTPPLFPS